MKKLVLPLNIIFLGLSLACDTALIITHLYPIKITASVFFMLAAVVCHAKRKKWETTG